MSWKPVMIIGRSERASNALRFATREEAIASAADLYRRWTVPTGYDAEETTDPVNYARDDGRDVPTDRVVFAPVVRDV